MSEIKTAFKAIEVAQNAILQIENIILNLPDNDKIKRLGGSSFSISSTELMKSGNFSPEYHDFKAQYRVIVETIKRSDLSNAMNVLERIIKEKYVLKGSHRINLHPEVINNLNRVL